MSKKIILTPKSSEKPKINGAKVFGVRPNHPFLFKIPATGKKPLQYETENLPNGLNIDSKTGLISGTITKPDTYIVKFKVTNELGSDQRDFKIIVGDTICLTPPMGWNSWYVHSLWVSQEKIERIAKAMAEKGLIDHGWTYVNIDDGWQGYRNKTTNILEPNPKFPDMKRMCDYIHSLGLKVGIYSTPWIGSYAGYIGGSSPNPEHDYSEYFSPMEIRKEPNQLFGDDHSYRKRLYNKFGTYYGDEDAKQWAEWGIDYLKYDWGPNDVENMLRMKESLLKSGRDIVYSMSNSAPFNLVETWAKHLNLWRTTGDINDSWHSISKIGFSQDKWQPFAGPGHWNDPDMLQVGLTAHPHKLTKAAFPTHLKPNEQYTQVSLWCLLSAPLLLSCDIENMDDFTLNLLTNDEVLEVDQDPLGEAARLVKRDAKRMTEVWAKNMEDGSKAVGLFNRSRWDKKVDISWKDLGLSSPQKVRDLWRQQDLGKFENGFSTKVPSHGVVLIRIAKT